MDRLRSLLTKNELQGFTVVELMITLVIGSFISAGILLALTSQNQSYIVQGQVAEMQQNLRGGILLIQKEMRLAGYDPEGAGCSGFTSATPTSAVFDMDSDRDGTCETYTYSYIQGTREIQRIFSDPANPSTASTSIVADNIDGVEFLYILGDGTPETTTPSNPADVEAVRITLLSRAKQPDRHFTNSTNYFPASCPQPASPALPDDSCVAGTVWDFDGVVDNKNSFDDNYRRRLLFSMVQCRNLKLGI